MALLDTTSPLATLREFIDWSPFFRTWQLKGAYPRILDDPTYGETAREDCTAKYLANHLLMVLRGALVLLGHKITI